MHQNEIAKNLLEDKTCETCEKRFIISDGEYCCSKSGVDNHEPLPECNTCIEWKKSMFVYSNLVPIIRTQLPTMIAEKIVGVQPMAESSAGIFCLKYKWTFKAWIKHILRKLRRKK